jgi:nucleoside-diphosphate-sugar epimerase
MKKKVFITGITSSIIQQLIPLIDFKVYEITGLSRSLILETNNPIKIIQGDIQNPVSYKKYLIDCDVIIHAAAITHSANEKSYEEINFIATKKNIDFAKKWKVKNFIYISSNTANSNNGAYSKSKILAERYLQENFKHWKIIRISEVFGGAKNEGLEKLIQNSLKKKVILYPKNMTSKFSPIYIDDASTLLYEKIFVNQEKNKILHINGKDYFTFQEILTLIRKNRKKSLITFGISKKMMFLIMRISKIIPFNIGVVPDQIERLYGLKTFGVIDDKNITLKLESYIKEVINKK